MRPLTPKQQRFVDEYLADPHLNATAAYIRAGYKARGHSAESAANRLLKNVEVAVAVKRRMDKRSERVGLTSDRVLMELARLAFSDPRKLYNPDGALKAPHEWDDDTAAAVAGVEVEEEFEPATTSESLDPQPRGGALKRSKVVLRRVRTTKVKRWDKNAALVNAMRHLGLLNDKLTHEFAVGATLRVVKELVCVEPGGRKKGAAVPGSE